MTQMRDTLQVVVICRGCTLYFYNEVIASFSDSCYHLLTVLSGYVNIQLMIFSPLWFYIANFMTKRVYLLSS